MRQRLPSDQAMDKAEASKKIVRTALGIDSSVELRVERVTGGITNKLFSCDWGAPTDQNKVLVRWFGAEGLIDREVENRVFAWLADSKIAPPLKGLFDGGRVEGWLHGFRPLKLDEMPLVTDSVARAMAQLHTLPIDDDDLAARFGTGAPVALWGDLQSWFDQASSLERTAACASGRGRGGADASAADSAAAGGPAKMLTSAERAAYAAFDFARLAQRMARLKEEILAAHAGDASASAFCHNDLLCNNIMVQRDGAGRLAVKLIDFEYGGSNYCAFDIANHLNEWTGGTLELTPAELAAGVVKPGYNGVMDFAGRAASPAQVRAMCAAYLRAARAVEAEATGGDSSGARAAAADTATELETLLRRVELCMELNHVYWGVWAVNMAFSAGCAAFDYMAFATSRLAQIDIAPTAGPP